MMDINRPLALLIIGVLLAAYAVLVMPPMVDDPTCIGTEINAEEETVECREIVMNEKRNQFRLPVAMAGGTVALVGTVLFKR